MGDDIAAGMYGALTVGVVISIDDIFKKRKRKKIARRNSKY